MRERSEKKPQDSKNKPKQPSKKQEWIQENKEGTSHKSRKNHNYPETQKLTPDKQLCPEEEKMQAKQRIREADSSHCNSKGSIT